MSKWGPSPDDQPEPTRPLTGRERTNRGNSPQLNRAFAEQLSGSKTWTETMLQHTKVGAVQLKQIRMQAIQIRNLLGKGGLTIRAILAQTGGEIKIDHNRNDPEGIVSIIGSVDKIETKVREVLLAKGCPLPIEGMPSMGVMEGQDEELEIADEMVGIFVGKGGENLKKIRDEVGGAVSIRVMPGAKPGAGKQRIQIVGDAEPRLVAKDICKQRMLDLRIKMDNRLAYLAKTGGKGVGKQDSETGWLLEEPGELCPVTGLPKLKVAEKKSKWDDALPQAIPQAMPQAIPQPISQAIPQTIPQMDWPQPIRNEAPVDICPVTGLPKVPGKTKEMKGYEVNNRKRGDDDDDEWSWNPNNWKKSAPTWAAEPGASKATPSWSSYDAGKSSGKSGKGGDFASQTSKGGWGQKGDDAFQASPVRWGQTGDEVGQSFPGAWQAAAFNNVENAAPSWGKVAVGKAAGSCASGSGGGEACSGGAPSWANKNWALSGGAADVDFGSAQLMQPLQMQTSLPGLLPRGPGALALPSFQQQAPLALNAQASGGGGGDDAVGDGWDLAELEGAEHGWGVY